MELEDFRRFIELEDFTDKNGGCAIAIASDSAGNATAFIKGNSADMMNQILSAMNRSSAIKQAILDAACCYRMIEHR